MDGDAIARGEVSRHEVFQRNNRAEPNAGPASAAPVMYSKYVTQTQLWQFMRHSGYELVYFRQECVGLFRPRNVTKIFAGFRGRQPSRLRARVSQ